VALTVKVQNYKQGGVEMGSFGDKFLIRNGDDVFGRDQSSDFPDFLFIGELASKLNLNPKAIRFYEKEGLIKPRRHGTFRTFLRGDVERLTSIVTMRRIGVSIAVLKSLYAKKECEPGKEFILRSLKDHLVELDKQKFVLESQLRETSSFIESLEIEKEMSPALTC
jgi:DNA-binding transcriptional MerR regulator